MLTFGDMLLLLLSRKADSINDIEVGGKLLFYGLSTISSSIAPSDIILKSLATSTAL